MNLVVGILLIALTTGFGQTMSGELIHLPPKSAVEGSSIEISAIYTGNLNEVTEAKLMYRLAGQMGYLEIPMNIGDLKIVGSIPSEIVGSPGVEYLMILLLSDGGMVAYPNNEDPLNNPVFLPVAKPTGEKSEMISETEREYSQNIIILTPEGGAVIPFGEEILIAVSLFNLDNVDPNLVNVFFDNRDVSAYATIGKDVVTYTPTQLNVGEHTVFIEASNIYGVKLSTISWKFRIQSAAQKMFDMKLIGYLNTAYRLDQIHILNTDTTQNQKYTINTNQLRRMDGSTEADFKWAKVKGVINISNLERDDNQPQNRYSLKIRNNYLRYTWGDETPMLNRLGLWGKRVRGHSVDLRFKWVNLEYVTGELTRPLTGLASFDTTQFEWSRTGYTYSRKLTGVRPSFGSGRTFQFGTFYVHSRDDVESVKLHPQWLKDGYLNRLGEYGLPINDPATSYSLEQIVLYGDTTDVFSRFSGANPQDNLVLGTDMKLALDNHRLSITMSGAVSLFNSNIRSGPYSRAELDTFSLFGDTLLNDTISIGDIDFAFSQLDDMLDKPGLRFLLSSDNQFDPSGPMADYFILNQSIRMPYDYVKFGNGFIMQSFPSLGLQFNAKLNYFRNFIDIDWKHIGREYTAFGSPLIGFDYAGWTISDKVRLLRNMLFLNLGYENITKNVGSINTFADPQTLVNSYSLGFTFNPGTGLPTLSTSIKSYKRDNNIDTLNIDTTIVDGVVNLMITDPRELNQTLTSTLSLSYEFALASVKNMISANIMSSSRNDLRLGREGELQSAKLTGLNLRTEWKIPLITNVALRLNNSQLLNESSLDYQKTSYTTFDVWAGYKMYKNKLQLRSGYRQLQLNKIKYVDAILVDYDQSQNNIDFRVQYNFPNVTKGATVLKNKLVAQFEARNYKSKIENYNYNDRMVHVRYELSF
jgi:hypothetical protein